MILYIYIIYIFIIFINILIYNNLFNLYNNKYIQKKFKTITDLSSHSS